MKKKVLLSLSGILVFQFIHAQKIILLPSAGVQTTLSTVEGSNPVLSNSNQFQTNFSGSLRAYMDNKKGHGLFFGISAVNHGVSVKTFNNIISRGEMSSVSTKPRIEIGYQLLSKPIYFNAILHNGIQKNEAKFTRGLFFQIQPIVGLGYNFISKNGGKGGIGSGPSALDEVSFGGNNFSLLSGGNFYIGKNGKQLFFISVMHNWNFGDYTASAIFRSQHNGNSYQNNIKSSGSGTTFSIGVPIRIGGKKKN